MPICDVTAFDADRGPFDVCIVGAGPVGVSIALALAPTGKRIAVLEAGGRKRSDQAQQPFHGELANPALHSPLHHFRVRAFGGSSQIWGGRCVPYDPIDFETRPWVSMPGWPIGYDDVLPYYRDANEAADAGQFDYDPRGAMVPGLDGEMLQTTIERFSLPTDFGRRYGATLRAAPNVHVVLNATVTAVRLAPNGDHVDHLEVAAPDKRRFFVRSALFVLAAGGLETTRLLLASNDVQQRGIGNGSDWLGRCYMSHMSATVGKVAFDGPPSAIAGDYERDADSVYFRRRLSVTPLAQRRLRILNLTFRLHLDNIADPTHNNPVLSLLYLARHVVSYEYRQRLWDARLPRAQRRRHLKNVISHPVMLTRFLTHLLHKRYLSRRQLPSIVLRSPENRYTLEFHSEQAPNPESRVMLSQNRDSYGLPRLRVDWRTTPLDIETIRQSYRLLASELERTETGRLTFDESTLEETVLSHGAFGGHHIGTARMSARPTDGVVDRNCQVHGVDNLFVAGTAIFPTSGQANPTLTALALAFRLAEYLKTSPIGAVEQTVRADRALGSVL
jgi:choline dehydrogenase-like flavoprotein